MMDEDADRYEKKYVKLVLVGTVTAMQGRAGWASPILYLGTSRINSILGLILRLGWSLARNMSMLTIRLWCCRFGIRPDRNVLGL